MTRALSWLEKQSWGEGQKQPQPLSVPGHSTGSTRRAAGHILQTDLRDSQLLVLFSTGSGSAWGLLWASISSHPAPCAAPLGLLWDQPIPAQGWDPPWGDTAPLNPGLTHLCSPGQALSSSGDGSQAVLVLGCGAMGWMWGHGSSLSPSQSLALAWSLSPSQPLSPPQSLSPSQSLSLPSPRPVPAAPEAPSAVRPLFLVSPHTSPGC